MKKILFSFAILFALSAQGQKKNLAVPEPVKQAFAKAHPSSKGTWEKEGGAYEVSFVEGGKNMSCVIDASGMIKETETVIPVTSLPRSVSSYIASHFKGQKVKEAAIIVLADGTSRYEAEIKGRDVLFDASGNVIRKKKDND